MKTRILIVAAMSFAIVSVAQKTELKIADKAVKNGDMVAAKTALEGIAGMISGAEAKYQSQYHFLRGQAYADLAKQGDNTAFKEAVASFKNVLDLEGKSGKLKYTSETNQRIAALTADMVNSAVADNGKEKFKEAAEKLYMAYKLSPKDTSYLYYAASSAVNGQHYEEALAFYNELQDVGYDGSAVIYKATNVATGEVESMEKLQRDLMVKSGTYKDPVDEKTPSKSAEIVKNTALIYTQTGQDAKALEAYKAARANDPKDVNLILNEANLHYKLGDKDSFKALMSEAAAVAPDNPDLHYNIGVINMEQGNIEEARASYKRALEVNPNYTNAQMNLSTTYVNEGNGLVDEMNSLGNSRKDIDRYEELKKQKDELFMSGAQILEDALKENPDNQGILTQLKNIYYSLGDDEAFGRISAMLIEE